MVKLGFDRKTMKRAAVHELFIACTAPFILSSWSRTSAADKTHCRQNLLLYLFCYSNNLVQLFGVTGFFHRYF